MEWKKGKGNTWSARPSGDVELRIERQGAGPMADFGYKFYYTVERVTNEFRGSIGGASSLDGAKRMAEEYR